MDEKKRAKLGQRFVCFSCEGKFYDLNKPEPICPKCGSNQLESPTVKKKPTRKRKSTAKKAKASRKRKLDEPPTIDDLDAGGDKDEAVAFQDLDVAGSEQIGDIEIEDD